MPQEQSIKYCNHHFFRSHPCQAANDHSRRARILSYEDFFILAICFSFPTKKISKSPWKFGFRQTPALFCDSVRTKMSATFAFWQYPKKNLSSALFGKFKLELALEKEAITRQRESRHRQTDQARLSLHWHLITTYLKPDHGRINYPASKNIFENRVIFTILSLWTFDQKLSMNNFDE